MLSKVIHALYRKWLLIIVIFLLAITSFRVLWMNVLLTLEYPVNEVATQGVLDLRGLELTDYQTLTLDGEWSFTPSSLLAPDQVMNTSKALSYIEVPAKWNEYFSTADPSDAFNYGTYQLRIYYDPSPDQTLAIRVQEIRSAYALYVNGQYSGGNGVPSSDRAEHEPQLLPQTIEISDTSGILDITIHASSHIGRGGITKAMSFGTAEAIQLRTMLSVGLQLLLFIVFLIHILYALILYLLGTRKKELLYFTMMLTCALLSVITVDDRLLFWFWPIHMDWMIKISIASYVNVMLFMLLMFDSFYPNYLHRIVKRSFVTLCCLYNAFLLFASNPIIDRFSILLAIQMVLAFLLQAYILSRALRDKEDSIFIVIAILSVGVNIFWTLAGNPLSTLIHYPFDLMFAVFAFAAFWFKRFFRTSHLNEQLIDKLRKEDKRKDEFLVNTSHELRNPLHGMINITHTLLADKSDPPSIKQRERLEISLQISRRMSFMLNDLMDITRLKERTLQLNVQNVKLSSVAVSVLDVSRFMLNGKPLTLHMDIADNVPTVKADEHRLSQILFNLVHNAIKYTEQGSITIRATKGKQGFVEVAVEDTGIGIAQDSLTLIFQPYEQAERHAHSAGGGFGLGLSICQQLVELHGGSISVASTPGKGSTFTFTLPEATDDEAVERVASASIDQEADYGSIAVARQAVAAGQASDWHELSASSVHKPAILIVDDDHINLRILSDMLEVEQYDVTTADSALQAMQALERRTFDLVISDIMMPHISGYEFTRQLRERFTITELPVLLLTARSDPQDVEIGFRAGANDYVCKPVDATEIKSRVRALTELKRSFEERLRLESAMLQSQIQPHFIFNAINSIAALAIKDVSKMQHMLEQFSKYLRLSFDFHNTKPFTLLKDELALVEAYLYIEKERFGERLQVEWNIDDKLHKIMLPPLSIQTLVENAVKHGIMSRSVGGTVRIAVTHGQDGITTSVADNGIGMTEERRIQLLRAPEGTSLKRSVGLLNLDRRLKRLYGHGVHIETQPDAGTTVSFRIPNRKAEQG